MLTLQLLRRSIASHVSAVHSLPRAQRFTTKALTETNGSSTSFIEHPDNYYSGLELNFMGTGSGGPTVYRNASCLAIRANSQSWLVDCGEGSTKALMASLVSLYTINRVFITHLHGDHIFGLPGLICSISALRSGTEEAGNIPLSIYGPKGLYDYVNACLTISESSIPRVDLTIHEMLSEEDFQYRNEYKKQRFDHRKLRREPICSIKKDGVEQWEVLDDGAFVVKAAQIRHTVDCFGYTFEEYERPGNIDVEKCQARGLEPGRKYGLLKSGLPVQTANGNVIHPHEVVSAAVPGRKVVVLGDTSNPHNIASLAENANLLVHECTMTQKMEGMARGRGHSSPRMAGNFAKKVNAHMLLLNHLSSRMNRYELNSLIRTAKTSFGSPNVKVAYDYMRVPIPFRLEDRETFSTEDVERFNVEREKQQFFET